MEQAGGWFIDLSGSGYSPHSASWHNDNAGIDHAEAGAQANGARTNAAAAALGSLAELGLANRRSGQRGI
jgi:hypothetical protein